MMAIASSLTLLGNMFGPTFGGFVAGHAGMRTAFIVNCLMLLVLAAVIWKSLENDTPLPMSARDAGAAGGDPQI
jgi:MFS family permease